MRDILRDYYNRELDYLRRLGVEFRMRYPDVASRLQLEDDKCDDPHVERLLEGFAFLAARVHLKIDEDFPELSGALLEVAYPQYTQPIPSMSVVQFHLDPEQGKLVKGLRLDRGHKLTSRELGGKNLPRELVGARCSFGTCYSTTLWPIEVAEARWRAPHELQPPIRGSAAVGAVRLELRCLRELTFAKLSLDRLRLHIKASPHLESTLYELLLNSCTEILIRDPDAPARDPLVLPASALRPVGFEADEMLLPVPRRSFLGYGLLLEYFAFPAKYSFLDLSGFDKARAMGLGGERLEVIFLIAPFERPDRRTALEDGVRRDTFRLGCVPVVNLFRKTAEPIRLTLRQPEYIIVPDARRRATTGIHSIESVRLSRRGDAEVVALEPFYSFRHGTESGDRRLFWLAHRRASKWRPEEGTDVFLSFLDRSGRAAHPELDTITVGLLCHNGSLPNTMPFATPEGDFEHEGGGPIERISTLTKPTPILDPALGPARLWRLISQLSLNFVSLADGGVDGIRELLRLNDFVGRPETDKQIKGLTSITSRPAYARIESEHGLSFARGQRIEIDFDDEAFTEGGVFLLASILERFFGLYVSLNSFTSLAVRTRNGTDWLRQWPPRSGWKPLL